MNEIKLQVIGCGDAFGSGGRFQTCYYVQSPSVTFLIDCGASSLVALKRHNICIDDIDLIVITHFHGDHFGGLPFIVLDAAVQSKRVKPFTIVSPAGCKERLIDLLHLFYPGLPDLLQNLKLQFIEFQSYETVAIDSLAVTAFPMKHTPATLPHALRIFVEDKIISFSGDTEWTDELIQVSENADLFICECNFFADKGDGHMNYNTIRENNHRLSYKNILLTHFSNEMLDNLRHVEMNCAEDGMIVIV